MLFKTEKQIQEDAKRFTSWRFAIKAFVSLLIIRIFWVLINIYILKKPFSFWTFCLDFVNEFTCPGIGELQDVMMAFNTFIIPAFGNFWFIPHTFFLLIIIGGMNPPLRKAIGVWLSKKTNNKINPVTALISIVGFVIGALFLLFLFLNFKSDKLIDLRKPIKENNEIGLPVFNWEHRGNIILTLPDGKVLTIDGKKCTIITNRWQSKDNLPKGEFGNLTSIDFSGNQYPIEEVYTKMLSYAKNLNIAKFEIKIIEWHNQIGKLNTDPSFQYRLEQPKYTLNFYVSTNSEGKASDNIDIEIK